MVKVERPDFNVRVSVCHMKVNLFSNPIVWENHVPHLIVDKHRGLMTHQTWTAGGIEKPALSLLKRAGCPTWERGLRHCGFTVSVLETDTSELVLSVLGDPTGTSLYPSFLLYKVEQISMPRGCP